jgi:hypothetical protein
LEQP